MAECCSRCLTVHVPPWRGCAPADLYRAEMGREPPEPLVPELAWQFEYRGSKADRERLLGRLTDGR